jgi:hypothetical protein
MSDPAQTNTNCDKCVSALLYEFDCVAEEVSPRTRNAVIQIISKAYTYGFTDASFILSREMLEMDIRKDRVLLECMLQATKNTEPTKE